MSTYRRAVWLLLAVVVFGWSSLAKAEAPTPPQGIKAKNFVVLVLDGERWTETWGDPTRANIPQRAKLAEQGALCTNIRNNGTTVTVPGHTAVCTGYYQGMVNDGSELPAHPSFMQLWLDASGAPAEQAWVITAKGKLNVLGKCADPAWKDRAYPSADCEHSDRQTTDIIKKTLTEKHPKIIVVNIKDPDKQGHAKDWEGYLKAIRNSDGYVSEVWQHLQADPFYKDQTALFVTNDHGRHTEGVKEGFVGHGCGCEGCRHIQLLVIGPDFSKGVTSDTPAQQIDIPVTIAYMLGITIPGSEGRVLTELFAAPAPGSVAPGSAAAKQPAGSAAE